MKCSFAKSRLKSGFPISDFPTDVENMRGSSKLFGGGWAGVSTWGEQGGA